MRSLVLGVAAGLAAATAAACSSPSSGEQAPPTTSTASATPSTTTASPSTTATTDWPTYHRTNDRAGQALGVPAPRHLARRWTAKLDGAVYGQPLVLGDLVIVATEHDSVYGLNRSDGAARWRRTLGTPMPLDQLPCGNIDPLGITGTPAYDASTDSVFVVAEITDAHHQLVALNPHTGAVRFTRSMDVTNRDRHAEQQRGALAVANGRVYVAFGGLAGDCGNYVGYVAATPVTGNGATTHYEVPTRREGGMWAASGVAVDAAGDVWVAVGNGASFHEPYDGSDSVLRLSADLSRRLDYFAPTNWGSENAEDADLGSTGPLLLDRGRVLISGKTGDVYLLAADHLGGIGGEVDDVSRCHGFGGMAWDAAEQAAFVPCTEGVLRIDVGQTSMKAGWRAAEGVTGSPVLGGGAVWSLNPRAGFLHVMAEASGRTLATAKVGEATRFASPVLSGNVVLVPTFAGVTALTIS